MALQKQPVAINFSRGLDTKTDPYQVPVGNFTALKNSIFTKTGRLTKRNGYQNITHLPNTDQTTLTTLNDNLIATGSNLYSFSKDTNQWLNKGKVQPVQLNTQPLVRVSTSQSSPDAAVAASGLTCLVYMDSGSAYYQISDSSTGEQIVSRTLLPSSSINPRAFVLGNYFVITFVTSGAFLQYISIPILNPTVPSGALNFTVDANMLDVNSGYDGYIVNNTLYMAWEGGNGAVNVALMNSALVTSVPVNIPASAADLVSVTADTTVNRIFVSFWDSSANNGYSAAFNYQVVQTMAKTQIITATPIREITSIATNNLLTVFYEVIHTYGAPASTASTDFISKVTVTPPVGTGTGTVSAPVVVLRSVGLASKAYLDASGIIYMLAVYGDVHQGTPSNNSAQPSYFLIDSTGAIYMRLAYANGGGYEASQVLPTITVINSVFYIPYLKVDLLATVNKGTALPSGTPTLPIYTQTGINLAIFTINDTNQHSSEIAGALHLTGGQLWEYDGVRPVEHGFQVWPENIVTATSGSGGLITADTYNYVFTYEWTDNQGNLHRSAPSIPVTQVTTGSTSTNTIYVPTLRLTYKLSPNPVRIVGYRWSTSQPVYYQFTSITAPVVNDTTIDYVTITDTNSDAQILGQTLLYTTGGVIENIAAPASIASALFKNRLFIIDAEDQNLLWFSKQVIENTPVEMSDLLTLYIAPTSGAQGSTGPMTALSAMDDKLIIFKKDAIYYVTGTGPDNTGANNDFTDPIFITSTVGCANPDSIVLIPNGLMFQSDKGIWLLGRDLSTNYIGAGVEQYNDQVVMAAQAIPATNQVRFILNNDVTLMYDYFFNQWGTHSNINAISATLYQGSHTYLNIYGQIFQELANTYIDGSVPVLMSLTTSWINVAGLQGY